MVAVSAPHPSSDYVPSSSPSRRGDDERAKRGDVRQTLGERNQDDHSSSSLPQPLADETFSISSMMEQHPPQLTCKPKRLIFCLTEQHRRAAKRTPKGRRINTHLDTAAHHSLLTALAWTAAAASLTHLLPLFLPHSFACLSCR